MHAARSRQALAGASAISLALVGSGLFAAGAPASGASAASAARNCGNHTITIELQQEQGQPPRPFKIQAKNVRASGVTCPAAYRFITTLYGGHSTTPPEHFKCKLGKAKEPAGYFNQVCAKGSKKIEFGGQGG